MNEEITIQINYSLILVSMMEIIKRIADRSNYTIKEVLTILKFSLIINADYSLKEKYKLKDLNKIWSTLPNKRRCLKLYTTEIARRKRKP